MSAAERLLIVGAGMAAGRLLQALVAARYPGSITVVGAEHQAVYNRVLLPGFLAGSHGADALTVLSREWFDDHGVAAVFGDAARAIDLAGRRITLESGCALGYDRLVLATGGTVPVPAIPGLDLRGVAMLRSLDDARQLRDLTAAGGPVAVVGGGLLGLETAQSLRDLGLPVCVIHRAARLLNRQLDATGAEYLARALRGRGIELVLGDAPVALSGTGRVSDVDLTSGARVPADTVVFATGTVAHDALAREAGLACSSGVLVDAAMRSSHPDVFAIGECARVGGACYALVAPVYAQADALAATLTGAQQSFCAPTAATRLKVTGIDVFSAGDIGRSPVEREIRISDPARGVYRCMKFQQDRLVGAVLVGDAGGSRRVEELIGAEAPPGATTMAVM
jgi:nitrite reductase (NADH) large subunit